MKQELLPCPFCGGRTIRSQIGESWPTHIVRCSVCGVEMLGSDKALLDIRWNNRVVKQSLITDRAEIEQLRARVAELEAERDEQNTVLREATQKLVELNVENAELEAEVESSRRARVDGLEAKVDYKICSNCKYEELQSTLEPCASCVGEEYPGWEPKEYTQ